MSPLKRPGHELNIFGKKYKHQDFTCFLWKHILILKTLLKTPSESYLGIPYLSLVDFFLVSTPHYYRWRKNPRRLTYYRRLSELFSEPKAASGTIFRSHKRLSLCSNKKHSSSLKSGYWKDFRISYCFHSNSQNFRHIFLNNKAAKI